MSLVDERRIGQFEILESIGSGGMGEVYAARDPNLGRKVAIKVIADHVASDRLALDRFAREARAASSLNHPNIITIHEVHLEADPPYIVMEWVDGRDVRSVIRGGDASVRKALDIAAQVAEGLAAAHENGIVHRDLKPENLMVRRDGLVKILDFGLAKQAAPPIDDDHPTAQMARLATQPGLILGTVGYMSPEQASGDPVDYRSDQFSFGAILYELLTGRRPFARGTAIDTLSAILHDQPEPLRSVNAKLPEPLAWIVERCLSKDAAERYASTRDLAHELRTLRERLDQTGSGTEPPAQRPAWFSPFPLLAIVAGLALAVAFTTLLWRLASSRGLHVPPSSPPSASSPLPTEKFLAVLPFKDLSGDPEGQLIIDGLSETLSARLARMRGIQVISASALGVMPNHDPKTIRARVGANLLLQGAVQHVGEQVRVSFYLINTERGVTLSGDTITGSSKDFFALQDAVADSVARSLRLEAPANPTAAASLTQPEQDRYLQALGYLQRHDNEASVDGAIGILEGLRRSPGSSGAIPAALGRAYLYKFWVTHDRVWADKAVEACEDAATLDPTLPEVHLILGQVASETGRPEAAVEEFNRAIAQRPDDVEGWIGLGNAYWALGNRRMAEEKLKRAIELRPGYWSSYSHLGTLYLRSGRNADAVRMFEKVLQLTPDNIRALNNLGVAKQRSADYDGAIAAFTKSLADQPNADAASNLGTCYFYLRRYPEAARAYERATALEPEFFILWSNLGDAYRWSPGMEKRSAAAYDRAIELAGRQLQLNPKDALARGLLAVCLAKRGRLAEAKTAIDIATSQLSGDVRLLYQAALVSELRGERRAAIGWLKEAAQNGYDPDEAERDPEFSALRKDPAFQTVKKSKG